MSPGRILPRSRHPYRTDQFTGWLVRLPKLAVTVTVHPGGGTADTAALKAAAARRAGSTPAPGTAPGELTQGAARRYPGSVHVTERGRADSGGTKFESGAQPVGRDGRARRALPGLRVAV